MAVRLFSARVSRRALVLVGFGVALPALLLAGIGIFLTLRIATAVRDESARYDDYIALQVSEAFERVLLDELRRSIPQAENAARVGGTPAQIVQALGAGAREFEAPWFIPENELPGATGIIVESTALLYSRGEGARRNLVFAGLLLRDPEGQVVGAGGWWLNPRRFLLGHFQEVVQDRLPENPRLYGGFVSTRRLSVAMIGGFGEVIARIRQPGDSRTARSESLTGPFEGYSIEVAPALGAPAVWVSRFIGLMVTFIGIMGLAVVVAAVSGVMYASRQLQLAQMKSSFVGNVTHELKTPIALIRLAADTLELGRYSTPEEGRQFLSSIIKETVRLQRLVDNILDFARLEAGQATFRFEAVDLLALVRETVDEFRPRLESSGFEVELDLPEELPPVRGDAVMLQHCVFNLLDNALKYSREERVVKVSAESRDAAVAVSVSDRGIGISPGDQKRIFEKFVRVETGLVHDVKGAGLGLSLVQQIVRAHGGRVEVESATGQGSTFTLVIPRWEGRPAAPGGARGRRHPGRETA